MFLMIDVEEKKQPIEVNKKWIQRRFKAKRTEMRITLFRFYYISIKIVEKVKRIVLEFDMVCIYDFV